MFPLPRRLQEQLRSRFFTAASLLGQWQRRCDRLTQLQRRIKFPPLESITVENRTLALPLQLVPPPAHLPSQEEIEYLIGFFDGDGCVTMQGNGGQIRLFLSQSFDSAIVLFRFRDSLGGGICRQNCATGTKKATLQWHASGSTMRHAANVLCRAPSMKQAQLQIAAERSVCKAVSAQTVQKLSFLKKPEHRPESFQCSWPYFAGFFDAEGSVTISPFGAHLQVEIGQLNLFVLQEIHSFLHKHDLKGWKLGVGSQGSSKLYCKQFATCKLTLQRLLDSGLCIKKKQVELALSLTADNHKQVREAISELNGYQTRYQRLDDKGVERAKEIIRVGQQLRNASSEQKLEMLRVKLEGLREEHALQNSITKCCRLRRHIRESLQDGGVVMPIRSRIG